jgi:hypothetical protein
MAALDFPVGTNGQIFAAPNGVVYRYLAPPGIWSVANVGDTAFVGDTPPATPATNQLWFNSALGQMFIWYNDGSGPTAQWVPTSAVVSQQPITWRLISRVVTTASMPGVLFMPSVIPADINDLMCFFDFTPVNNNVDALVQLLNASGTVIGANYNWSLAITSGVQPAGAPAGTSAATAGITNYIPLNYPSTNNRIGNNAGNGGIAGDVTIYNIRDTVRVKRLTFKTHHLNELANAHVQVVGAGLQLAGGAIGGLQIGFTSPIAAGGTVTLWGSP